MHWYKRDPDAALAGMTEMNWEEMGAYNHLLDLLYSRDGEIPDDDAKVAKLMHVRVTQWRRMKARLIELGKVWTTDGKLTARRVEKTLKEARKLSESQTEKVCKRWQESEKPNENNDPPIPSGITSTTTTRSRKEERVLGFGKLEKKKTWPYHGCLSKRRGTIWLQHGSSDFDAYATDYRIKNKIDPPLDENGGYWFNVRGEAA